MISRRSMIYAFALAATAVGIWMMFGGDDAPAAGPGGAAKAGVRVGKKGGYLGGGAAQVAIDRGPATTVPPQGDHVSRETLTPQQAEAERRLQDLKKVLGNIEGEPIYVEGIDGPAPERPAPKKNSPRR